MSGGEMEFDDYLKMLLSHLDSSPAAYGIDKGTSAPTEEKKRSERWVLAVWDDAEELICR